MIQRKPIRICDRDKLFPYFENIENSMYNFATVFMWQGNNNITYDIISDCLVLFYQKDDIPASVSYPIGNGDKKEAISIVSSYIKDYVPSFTMRNISENMKDELMLLCPDEYEFLEDETTFDYIYSAQKLIDLSGKELHSKRNHYNYFKKNYDYKYRRMHSGDIDACKELFNNWISEKDDDIKWIQNSKIATFEALDNLNELNLTGGVITIDEEIVAFSVGEKITNDMALIHLEVASPHYRGAFNTINHDFCENEWADCTYINREEDMGLLGLRKAKMAYKPIYMLKKYNATKIN